MPGILEKSRGISSCRNLSYCIHDACTKTRIPADEKPLCGNATVTLYYAAKPKCKGSLPFHYFSAVLMPLVFLGILVIHCQAIIL